MGWFRRKRPLDVEVEKFVGPETYVSLTSGKKVIKNLDRMVIENRKIVKKRKELERMRSWGHEKDQFISNIDPKTAMELERENGKVMIWTFFSLCGLVFLLVSYLVLSSARDIMTAVGVLLTIGVSTSVAFAYLYYRVRKNDEKLQEVAVDDRKATCVVSLLDGYMAVEFDDGFVVHRSEVSYEHIDDVEPDGMEYLRNKGVRFPLRGPRTKIRMAPHPGNVSGGLYPISTPAEQLVVIKLKGMVPVTLFRRSSGLVLPMVPDINRDVDRVIISIREDDKPTFVGSFRGHLKDFVPADDIEEEDRWQ